MPVYGLPLALENLLNLLIVDSLMTSWTVHGGMEEVVVTLHFDSPSQGVVPRGQRECPRCRRQVDESAPSTLRSSASQRMREREREVEDVQSVSSAADVANLDEFSSASSEAEYPSPVHSLTHRHTQDSKSDSSPRLIRQNPAPGPSSISTSSSSTSSSSTSIPSSSVPTTTTIADVHVDPRRPLPLHGSLEWARRAKDNKNGAGPQHTPPLKPGPSLPPSKPPTDSSLPPSSTTHPKTTVPPLKDTSNSDPYASSLDHLDDEARGGDSDTGSTSDDSVVTVVRSKGGGSTAASKKKRHLVR